MLLWCFFYNHSIICSLEGIRIWLVKSPLLIKCARGDSGIWRAILVYEETVYMVKIYYSLRIIALTSITTVPYSINQ